MTAATVMSPLAPGATAIRTRDAVPGDNAALVALSSACAMTGDVGLCVDRAPDFFALNRLEGDRWRVGVATVGKEAAEDVAGCIAVAERMAYVRGAPVRVGWVSDFKVHPRHRGGPVADALTRWASATGRALLGRDDAPLTMTILAGNVPMERRAAGQRGLPVLAPFADLDAWAVPLLWRRRTLVDGVRVARASERDVEEMAALWHPRYGDRRQELVFIGTGMEEADLRQRLDDCLLLEGSEKEWAGLEDPFPRWRRESA